MISAVVLTRGDKDLSRCLKSLSFCSEVLVIKKNKIEDFSAQRNLGLKKAKNKWVLFIDDDEVVSVQLRNEILSLKDTYQGYYLNRENLFLGKVVGRDKILRLAQKNSGKWERIVHEEWKVNGKIGEFRGPLVHETVSIKEAVSKTNFYTTLHARQNIKDGKGSNIFKIILFPPAKLLQNLVVGKGFVFGFLHSLHSFLAWSKIWLLQTNLQKKP